MAIITRIISIDTVPSPSPTDPQALSPHLQALVTLGDLTVEEARAMMAPARPARVPMPAVVATQYLHNYPATSGKAAVSSSANTTPKEQVSSQA